MPSRSRTCSSSKSSRITTMKSQSLFSSKSPTANEPCKYAPRKLSPRMPRAPPTSSASTPFSSAYGVATPRLRHDRLHPPHDNFCLAVLQAKRVDHDRAAGQFALARVDRRVAALQRQDKLVRRHLQRLLVNRHPCERDRAL